MNQFIILITSFSDDKKKLQQLSLGGHKDKAKDKGRVILKFTFSKLKMWLLLKLSMQREKLI